MKTYRELLVGEQLEHGDEVWTDAGPRIYTVVQSPRPGHRYTADAAARGMHYRRPAVPPARPVPVEYTAVVLDVTQSDERLREQVLAEVVPVLMKALREAHNELRFEAIIANQVDSGTNLYNNEALFCMRKKIYPTDYTTP